jgi:hypothetical protein
MSAMSVAAFSSPQLKGLQQQQQQQQQQHNTLRQGMWLSAIQSLTVGTKLTVAGSFKL